MPAIPIKLRDDNPFVDSRYVKKSLVIKILEMIKRDISEGLMNDVDLIINTAIKTLKQNNYDYLKNKERIDNDGN